jgi:hypothetical protein
VPFSVKTEMLENKKKVKQHANESKAEFHGISTDAQPVIVGDHAINNLLYNRQRAAQEVE